MLLRCGYNSGAHFQNTQTLRRPVGAFSFEYEPQNAMSLHDMRGGFENVPQ